jgi:Immunoglobulin domain/Bacterial Ig domain/Immunoglobulin I-set domain
LQAALLKYANITTLFSAVDCDFLHDNFWDAAGDIVDCPYSLGALASGFVIDSEAAFTTFAADELLQLASEVLDSYLNDWIDDINEGLYHWSEFGLATSKGLFDPQARRNLQNSTCAIDGTDGISGARADCENKVKLMDVVKDESDVFMKTYMQGMLGVPDVLTDLLQALDPIIDDFNQLLVFLDGQFYPITATIDQVKGLIIQKLEQEIQNVTGVDIEALDEFLTHPSRWVCLDGALFTFPDPIGTVTVSLFAPGDHDRLDTLLGFTASDHESDTGVPAGCGRLLDSSKFNPDNFAAIKNSITMSKLLLLDGVVLNQVLSDISCRTVTTYQPGDNIMITSLATSANPAPLPWLRLIDGDHAWRDDGLPRFCNGDYCDTTTRTTPRPKELNGGSGDFPIWESCELRPAFRVLFTDWENGAQNFPDLFDTVSGDCPCFQISDLHLDCLGPGYFATNSAQYMMHFSMLNNLTNSISYVAITGLPSGVSATPQPIHLETPLMLGQIANVSTIINVTNVTNVAGSINFNISVGSVSIPSLCSEPQCASLRACCSVISDGTITATPSPFNPAALYSYAFTLGNLAANPVQSITLIPLTQCFGITPNLITLNTPLAPGNSTTLDNIQLRVDPGCYGNFCFRVITHDANSVELCDETHCLPALPDEGHIVIGWPTNGAVLSEFTNFQISAVVATNVTPVQVSFYLNGTLVVTTNAPPFTVTLSGLSNGFYSLVGAVTDTSGVTFYSNPTSLTVTQAPSLVITQEPLDQTVVAGSSVMFSVEISGRTPVQYQWFNDGGPLGGATNASVTLTNLQAAAAGRYVVRISNAGGVVISRSAQLTVNIPPSITFEPASQTNSPGGAITFRVTATGTPPLYYAWLFNNALISGATNTSLTLTNLQPAQAGNYKVAVSNLAGTATSTNATLTLRPDVPRIVSGPASQTVTKGSAVTFSVSAAGALPLSYQWRFNLTNLAGATSSTLTLPNVREADAGIYGVTVTNVFGASSAAAGLAVLVPFVTLFDDFEAYLVGSNLHGQAGWAGWTNNPNAGALVSTNFAFSPNRSVDITGASDLVHTFPDATNGQWVFSVMQYILSTSTGTNYVILLNTYRPPYGTNDLNWSVQIQNNMDTGQIISDFGGGATLPMVKDQWVEERCEINLASNSVSEFYNGQLLSTHAWQGGSGGPGLNEIQALDLYAGGSAPVYYDNVTLSRLPLRPVLSAAFTLGTLSISWSGGGVLQQSSDLVTWADLFGATSPYSTPVTAAKMFYRARQ